MFRLTPVVKVIVIINAALFAISALARLPLSQWLGFHFIYSSEFAPHQIITHMFVHGGFFHLFSNMFALVVFGTLLEQVLGQKRLILLYMISGLGGLLFYSSLNYYQMNEFLQYYNSFVLSPDPDLFRKIVMDYSFGLNASGNDFMYDLYPQDPQNTGYIQKAQRLLDEIYSAKMGSGMVGASGAVFGILISFALLFPNMELMLLFPPIPVKAKYLVTFYGIYEIISTLNRNPDDNVAHLAHIGGMVVGFILIKYWKIPRYQ